MTDAAASPDLRVPPHPGEPAAEVRKVATAGARTPWLSGVAVSAGGLIPLLAYLGNLGFAPAVALGGLACLPLLGRPRNPSRGIWLLIGLLVWALASYAWSPALQRPPDFRHFKDVQRLTGLKLVLELALYGAFALAMQRVSVAGARKASWVLAVGLTGLAVLLVVEAAGGATLYSSIKAAIGQPTRPDLAVRNVARATYVIALLFWPVALFMLERNWRAPLVLLSVTALLCPILLHVDAPLLALIVGGAVFLLVRRAGRLGLWLCLGGAVVYLVMAPIVLGIATGAGLTHETPGHIGKLSWSIRLHIWSFVERLILAHPITGWGLDASRVWPDAIPLHPHDGALQLWLELGAVGVGLATLFVAWLFSRIAVLEQAERGAAAAAAASLSAYLVIGALSFGVWQEWWLALAAVAMAACGWLGIVRRDQHLGSGKDRPLAAGTELGIAQ